MNEILETPLAEPTVSQQSEQQLVVWAELMMKVWHRRRFVLRVAIIALVGSSILSYVVKPKYRSTAQIMPPQSGSGDRLSLLAGLAGASSASFASDALDIKTPGALYIGILNSRTIEDRLIDQVNLQDAYKTPRREQARQILAANTRLTEDKKAGLIAISVTDTNPNRAAAIVTAYVDNLNWLLSQCSTSSARQERKFLEARLDSVRLELDTAQAKLGQFSSKTSTYDVKDQAHATFDAASKLQAQLISAQSELRGLQVIYAPENAQVRASRARVAELQSNLDRLSGSHHPESDDSIDGDYPNLRQLPILGIRYADIYRQVRTSEAVYEALTRQWELAKVQEAKEIPVVQLLDPPDVPRDKVSPSRRVIVLSYTLSGLIAAILWVVATDWWLRISPDNPIKKAMTQIVRDTAAFIHRLLHLMTFRRRGITT